MGLVKPKPMRSPKDGNFFWQGDRNLSEYDAHFETAFLQKTQEESSKAASRWNSSSNCPEYLSAVKKFLANEETNADFWLQPETKQKMLKIVETELITKMADVVSSKETGCVFMF